MASASLATVAAPVSGSHTEFALQGEAAWDDELDVGKSARHSSGSHATGIVRQPARSRNGGDRAILFRREQNQTNPICIQRMHTAERVRTRLTGLPSPGLWGPRGGTHGVFGPGGSHILPSEHSAGSEHHRSDRRRQSFCPLAQGLSVVVPELCYRRGIDCDRLHLRHDQRTGNAGSSDGSAVRRIPVVQNVRGPSRTDTARSDGHGGRSLTREAFFLRAACRLRAFFCRRTCLTTGALLIAFLAMRGCTHHHIFADSI